MCDDAEYGAGGEGVPGGMFWSWPLDFEAFQAALNSPAPWSRGRKATAGASGSPAGGSPADSGQDPETQTRDAARAGDPAAGAEDPSAPAGDAAPDDDAWSGAGVPLPDAVVAGRVVEGLPPGPGLAGWLALAEPGELEDGALAGVAGSFRRLASWAQAGELAVVAQIAARTAARDPKAGVAQDGRPVQIPRGACSEVALGLALSEYGAAWWTDLGVTLRWRLAATWAALHAGRIDLYRARLIAEHTAVLSEDAARAVEQQVLPGAGDQTASELRAVLRRVVIAVAPEAAVRRREEAERRAKVSLYGDEGHTATLAGSGLPVAQAAAAMARISALARAVKSSGAPGGISLHRAQVFLGLLLGTLPYIPPAGGAPAEPPPDLPPDAPPPGPVPPPVPPVPPGPAGPWDDVPCPGDQDAPPEDDPYPAGQPSPPDEDTQIQAAQIQAAQTQAAQTQAAQTQAAQTQAALIQATQRTRISPTTTLRT